MTTDRDINNIVATAKRDSKAEGKLEGKTEEKLETAQRMKAMGLDIEIIAEATQLSPEQIEKL